MIIGLGSDLCNIERIANSLERYGERFENHVFTEIERAKARRRPYTIAGTYAKRFAAKEACAKALGSGIGEQVSFQDLTVTRVEGERPKVALSERVQQVFPNITVHLSLSDDGEYAQAFAVAEQR